MAEVRTSVYVVPASSGGPVSKRLLYSCVPPVGVMVMLVEARTVEVGDPSGLAVRSSTVS
jgi:hypothetical protein